jgi:uncharacterized membrane protein
MPAVSTPSASAALPTSTAALPATPGAGPALFIRATRAIAVLALVGLILLGLAWELWLAPTGNRTLAIKVLPLLVPLAGLLKHRLYTYRWVSMLVWLYFIEGVVRGNGLQGGAVRWLGWGEVALCTVLFVACAAHVRWRLKHKNDAGEPAVPNLPG